MTSSKRPLLDYVAELIHASMQLKTAFHVPAIRQQVVNEVYFALTRTLEDMRRDYG